jgi:hypothetical protein
MPKDFKIIYKILRRLESALDNEELLKEDFSAEALGVSEECRRNLFSMLYEGMYIRGLKYTRSSDGDFILFDTRYVRITLKGLQYLYENSMMKKAAHAARGITFGYYRPEATEAMLEKNRKMTLRRLLRIHNIGQPLPASRKEGKAESVL